MSRQSDPFSKNTDLELILKFGTAIKNIVINVQSGVGSEEAYHDAVVQRAGAAHVLVHLLNRDLIKQKDAWNASVNLDQVREFLDSVYTGDYSRDTADMFMSAITKLSKLSMKFLDDYERRTDEGEDSFAM